jgi:hypothetical protein
MNNLSQYADHEKKIETIWSRSISQIKASFSIPFKENGPSVSHMVLPLTHPPSVPHMVLPLTPPPFTWPWVAMLIGEGLLVQAGAAIFLKIFGSSQQDRLGIDFTKFIEDILQGVSAIIQRKLEESSLREILANLEAIQINMSHYINNPNSLDRLQNATTDIVKVCSQLKSLGLLGHEGYMVALTVHLLVLDERSKAINGQKELLNIKDTINMGISHAKDMHKQWKLWNEGRFEIHSKNVTDYSRPVERGRSDHERTVFPYSIEVYTFTIDGKEQTPFGSEVWGPDKGHVERRMQQHINMEWDQITAKHVGPSQQVINKWEQKLAQLP